MVIRIIIMLSAAIKLAEAANCLKTAIVYGANINSGGATFANDDTDTSYSLVPTGTATVSCNTNYIWTDGNVGSKVYTCTAQDTWTVEDANMNCAAVCTKPPTTGTNVAATPSSYSNELGTMVSAPTGAANLACEANHIWSDGSAGLKALLCTGAGTWATSPTCTPVCVQPPTLGSKVSTTITYDGTLGTGYSTAPSGTASVQCETYHAWSDGATGVKQLTCTAAGTWDTSLDCLPVCTKPPTIGTQVSGVITYATELGASFVKTTGTATLSCNTNHVWSSDGSTGTKSITCNAANTWDTSPDCTAVCTKTNVVLGANVDTTVTYTGELATAYVVAPTGTVVVSCAADHVWSDGATGTKSILCSAAETWGTSPYCVPACLKPPTLGTQVSTTLTYTGEIGTLHVTAPSGTAITTCNSGYIWSDGTTSTKTLTCTAANTWDTSLACVQGHVSASTGTAVTNCDADHIWSDGTTASKTLTCSAVGEWSASENCVPVCTKPPPTGTFVQTTPTAYTKEIGTGYVQAPSAIATVQCETNYLWYDGTASTKSVYCVAAGTWKGVSNCVAVCQKPLTLGANVNTEVSYSGTLGTTNFVTTDSGSATISCQAGFVWADGYGCDTRVVKCSSLLTWETSPACVTYGTVTQSPCPITTTTQRYISRVGNRKGELSAWYLLVVCGAVVAAALITAIVYGIVQVFKDAKKKKKDAVRKFER